MKITALEHIEPGDEVVIIPLLGLKQMSDEKWNSEAKGCDEYAAD